MNSILAKLLGIDPSKLKDVPLDKLKLSFVGLPQSWWALLSIVTIAAFVWLSFRTYRREGKHATPRLKNFLACLRLAAILLVLFVLFQPTLVIDKSSELRSAVVVLVDNSMSMSIQDKVTEPKAVEELAKTLDVPPGKIQQMSRLDIARRLLEQKDFATLKALDKDFDLELAMFGDSLQTLPLRPETPKLPGAVEKKALPGEQPFVLDLETLAATGQSTNLEQALRGAVSLVRGQPLKAAVLITDGQANAGDSIAAARALSQKGVQVYTFGIGDPNPPKNIEVSNVIAPNVAFKEDDLIVTVNVTQQGYRGKPVRLALIESSRAGEKGHEVAFKNDTLDEDGKPKTFTLKYKPETVGVLTLRVEVAEQPGEVITEDNAASTIVRVVDQKAQVLFVSGSPGKEYRYLKNFLIRDTTIQAQCWLQNTDPLFNQECSKDLKPLEKFPSTEEELFKYDVIILLDPDPTITPREITPEWAQLVRKFVGEHGGGLIYIAGNLFSEDLFGGRELAALGDVLPIEVGKAGLTFQERLASQETASPLLLTPQGLDNPMFKLESDEALNKKLWVGEGGLPEMPGIYWSQPVYAMKPGGVALAVHSDPRRVTKDKQKQPLVAMQFYGVGRSVFLGFNSTWRWRFIEQGKYFDQFWGQAVRFVSQGRLLGGRKRILVFTDKDTYTKGQQVEVRIRMLEQDYEHPMLKSEVVGVTKAEDGSLSEIKLTPDPSCPGDYRGSFLAEKQGLVEISPKILDPQLADKMANKIIHVTLPRLEFKETRMNEAVLRQMADVTHADYLKLSDYKDLPRRLKSVPTMLVKEDAEDLWDAPLVLYFFCLLLFTEWIIRKMKNMA